MTAPQNELEAVPLVDGSLTFPINSLGKSEGVTSWKELDTLQQGAKAELVNQGETADFLPSDPPTVISRNFHHSGDNRL